MADNIPTGITKADILQAISDFDSGIEHGFAPSTKFDLVLDGKRYPPKAILGLAARRTAGRLLRPDDFSAGVNSKCFRTLEKHGFRIEPKASEPEDSVTKRGEELDQQGYFNADNLDDRRDRHLKEIAQRQGQPLFRKSLIDAYDQKCAISGCDAVQALEAAHIMQHLGAHSQHVTNGLLLRADIHTIFDLNLIGINPVTLKIAIAPVLKGTTYEMYKDTRLRAPSRESFRPDKKALANRWNEFLIASTE